MSDPRDFILKLDPVLRPPSRTLNEHIIPDFEWFAAHRSSARPAEASKAIEGIVIHATAGSTSAGAVNWWRRPAVKASAHWLIPAEREALHGTSVIAVVPEARAAWHVLPACAHPAINAGKACINGWSLGIEIVNTQSPDDLFSAWQVQATADIVRYAWAKYPNLRWVFSHAAVDPKRRSDPGRLFPWADLTRAIVARPIVVP